jgi:tetratricopeptide (TPR) repeat protein
MSHTSAAGAFSFQWSTIPTSAYGDASQTGRVPTTNGSTSLTGSRNGSRGMDPLANCDLMAESPGYSSSKVSLYDRAGQDNYDVGVIVLHRIVVGEGRTVSAMALRAPKDAKKEFDKGTSLAAANKLSDAEASFERALAAYPEFADAWLGLGRIQWQMGSKDTARESFRKSMDLDRQLVGPWQELGYLACDDSQWEDALRYLDQAVRLDPMDSPNAWFFHALANYNLGKYDQAERSLHAEIKLANGANHHVDYLMAEILIARKDLRGGAQALRNYIASAGKTEDVTAAEKQLSRVESQIGE